MYGPRVRSSVDLRTNPSTQEPTMTCDFCEKPALYDFKTKMGPWANGCKDHYRRYRAFKELGVGKGQSLDTEDIVL